MVGAFLWRWGDQAQAVNWSQAVPRASESTVMTIPARAYSQNEISTSSRRAISATIRLATDPSKVRLRQRGAGGQGQPRRAHGQGGHPGLSSNTAGTLETNN